MKRTIASTVIGIIISMSAATIARADSIFGWWGSAQVQVPGRGLKVVVVKGVISAPDASTALSIGKEHGRNQAGQYGTVLVGPTIELISPFYVPSIQDGVRDDLRPSGG